MLLALTIANYGVSFNVLYCQRWATISFHSPGSYFQPHEYGWFRKSYRAKVTAARA